MDVVVQNSITVNKSTSLPPWIVGLVVFGGTYPESKKAVARNAFEDVLNKESCIDAWAKVGEAPCTIECLKDDQVRRTLWEATEVRKTECDRLEKVAKEGKAVLELGKPIYDLLKS